MDDDSELSPGPHPVSPGPIDDLPRGEAETGRRLTRSWRLLGATAVSLLVPGAALALSYCSGEESQREITLDTVASDTDLDTTVPDSTTVAETTTPESSTTTLVDTTVSGSTSTGPEITNPPALLGIRASMFHSGSKEVYDSGEVVPFSIRIHNPDNVTRLLRVVTGFSDPSLPGVHFISDIRTTGCGTFNNSSGTKHVGLWMIYLGGGQSCVIAFDVKTMSEFEGFIAANAEVGDDGDIEIDGDPGERIYRLASGSVRVERAQQDVTTTTSSTSDSTLQP